MNNPSYIHIPPELRGYAIETAMKPDERIVCTDATVVMDSAGRLSYFRNDAPPVIVEAGDG